MSFRAILMPSIRGGGRSFQPQGESSMLHDSCQAKKTPLSPHSLELTSVIVALLLMIAYFYTGTLFGTNAPLLIPQDNSLSSSVWTGVGRLLGSSCCCSSGSSCCCSFFFGPRLCHRVLGVLCFRVLLVGMWLCLVEAEAKACSEKISTKRQTEGPKPGFMVEGASLEAGHTHIPSDVILDLKGGY
ncbi:hypothetical protein IFM89_031085 [Coptis chinensis]|uniref:Uncharacterized protein n=1 Tax=Coptis chinensis TaxID=261450 RepID=A0A835MAC2_9MAGN|nr:hypothetical protein IFM89_031085 [Coptis chinensis]